jgi:hypothetical protein
MSRIRYIQDPVTFKLVTESEYRRQEPNKSALIMPDISPYVSMIDGSVINSRSKHRTHLRDHGCIEVGNEKMERNTPKLNSPLPEIIEAANLAGLIGDYHAHKR